MNIRCIVVDDEPLAIEKLTGYIQRVPTLTLQASFSNAFDAIEFLRDQAIDLMFLDIQMETFTGIQLLETVRNLPKVIITTAYESYALKGYELDVTDYLLKPISFDRFLKSVNKAGELLRSESASFHSSTTGEGDNFPSDFLFVKADYHIHKVRLSDILFIEGMKDYLRIHLPNERIMTLMSFIRMEKALPPERFMRVHKSFIVSLEKIERIERNIILVTTHKIPIGNKYKKQFFDFIGKDMMSGQRRHFCTGLSGQTM